MALRLYPRICSDRKGKAVAWLREAQHTARKRRLLHLNLPQLPPVRLQNLRTEIATSSHCTTLSVNPNVWLVFALQLDGLMTCFTKERSRSTRVSLSNIMYRMMMVISVGTFFCLRVCTHTQTHTRTHRYDWATRFSGSSIDDWHLIEMNETELSSLVPRRRNMILEFIRVAPDADRRTACYYLEKSCFHSQRALQNYFDSGHQSPPNDFEMPSQYIVKSPQVTSTKEEEDVAVVVTTAKNNDEEVLKKNVIEEEETEIRNISGNSTTTDSTPLIPSLDTNTMTDDSGTRYGEQQLKEKPLCSWSGTYLCCGTIWCGTLEKCWSTIM